MLLDTLCAELCSARMASRNPKFLMQNTRGHLEQSRELATSASEFNNMRIDYCFSSTNKLFSIFNLILKCEIDNRSITLIGGDIQNDALNRGLVRDGTPCGENLVCVNQTCISIFPYIDTSKCPTDNAGKECSGHGVSSKRI